MFRRKHISLIVFLGISISFITFSIYFYQIFYTPNICVRRQNIPLYISEGATIHHVLDSLVKHRCIENKVSFMFVSKLFNYHKYIKPGFYLIEREMNNLSFINLLRSGLQTPLHITFSPAKIKKSIARKLCHNLALEAGELLSLMNNQEFVRQYGFDTSTVACVFIPNTYELYWNISAESLFERMIREYRSFWKEDRRKKAKLLGLNPIQVSILASIVQSETTKSEEKSRIAGVYMNRLKRNIPLESCPTVIFATGDFELRRVLKKHLIVNSPYNTYIHKGLPPGPINTPTPSSIDMVLNYEKHKYLYMCAKENFSGYHRFAVNFKQHLINAQKYRQAFNRLKTK